MSLLSSSPDDPSSDAVLIARVQRGDHDAFAKLVEIHLAPVRAYVAMKLPVPHLADELTHETFVFAFQNLGDFELRHSFRAWLRAIAFNFVRRELLRFARERQNLSRLEQEQIHKLIRESEKEDTADEVGFLEECLAQLPESMRRLVDERYRQGRAGNEIAAEWQRSPEWVRVTLLRVRRKLRECIEGKMEAAHGH
jgi:RNA polymerase sigma-70 factor (ECF subfamily)